VKGLADIKRKAAAKMYGQVDEAELSCRMLEAAQEMRRPNGASAIETLAQLDPESRAWLRRQATAAMVYFMECLNASERPQ
jgi:hypothetical protein